jgi:outer membrane protein OmpA-like peptidoglycan-associated protein
MALRRRVGWLSLFFLAGCTGPVGLYHDAEGGAIAQGRQPPPGQNLPYPNLAGVPAAPVVTGSAQADVAARVAGTAPPDVSPPAPGALAGLALPAGPPPLPNVPDLVIPKAAPAVAATPAAAPVAPTPPPSAPVALAFPKGSAVLPHDTAVALTGVAAAAGGANILVGGFGDAASPGDPAALALALARARRLADALTAAGVDPAKVRMTAAAQGSGGFVQLVY